MKKACTAWVLASMLLMTGCASESSTTETAENTTIQTTSTQATTTKVPDTTTEDGLFLDKVRLFEYDTYGELMAAYTKGRSDCYVYPLPDIVDTWELTSTSLCPSNYTLYYTDTANQVKIMLEIDYTSTYNKISEYFDGIAYSYGASSIVEMTDRYAVKHYMEFDNYAILGITGEQNIMYTLVVGSDDETVDRVALLKEYKDILEL